MSLDTKIDIEKEFFITAYTEINACAKPTTGLGLDEFIIGTREFLFFLHQYTNIYYEIENDLQSLSTKNGRPLLTAFVDIDLFIEFVEDVLDYISYFHTRKFKKLSSVFLNLQNYLKDAKNNDSNIITFECYKKN